MQSREISRARRVAAAAPAHPAELLAPFGEDPPQAHEARLAVIALEGVVHGEVHEPHERPPVVVEVDHVDAGEVLLEGWKPTLLEAEEPCQERHVRPAVRDGERGPPPRPGEQAGNRSERARPHLPERLPAQERRVDRYVAAGEETDDVGKDVMQLDALERAGRDLAQAFFDLDGQLQARGDDARRAPGANRRAREHEVEADAGQGRGRPLDLASAFGREIRPVGRPGAQVEGLPVAHEVEPAHPGGHTRPPRLFPPGGDGLCSADARASRWHGCARLGPGAAACRGGRGRAHRLADSRTRTRDGAADRRDRSRGAGGGLPERGSGRARGAAGPRLAGKLVIDAVVPLAFVHGVAAVAPVPGAGSVGELLDRRLTGARVVSAFKTLPAGMLGELARPLEGDVILCGEDATARAEVRALVARLPGLRAVDAGGIVNARALGALAALLINVNRRYRAETTVRIIGVP